MEIVDLLEYSERAQLRTWFEQHAASQSMCWIAMYRGKKKPEGICLPYLDVVEEALCFGWIDSTLKRLPDGRLAQRLSPRQKRSHWTELKLFSFSHFNLHMSKKSSIFAAEIKKSCNIRPQYRR